MATIAVAVPARWRALFFDSGRWERLAALGTIRVAADDADLGDPAVLADLAGPADVLVTGWACAALDEPVLRAAPHLRLMAHTGASVKAYATAASFARGVRVTQAGAAMAYAVGEQALALTLALLHRTHRFDHALRTGVPWEAAKEGPGRRELRGCPVGVIGASRTGRAYIDLVRALGADVAVTDPYLSDRAAAQLGVTRLDLPDLLRSSTVVALHAPVLPETRHMIGVAELALLRDGALLVNTARSALVDEAALVAELRTGRIDAALDVFDAEPLPVDHPLRRLPNVLLTPHEAGGTREARRRAGDIVIDEVRRFRTGEPLRHEVTAELLTRMG